MDSDPPEDAPPQILELDTPVGDGGYLAIPFGALSSISGVPKQGNMALIEYLAYDFDNGAAVRVQRKVIAQPRELAQQWNRYKIFMALLDRVVEYEEDDGEDSGSPDNP